MNINGKHHHTIWVNSKNKNCIDVIDQRYLPHKIDIYKIQNTDDAAYAIKEMVVRGAPLIGVTAAYGMYLACIEACEKSCKLSYFKDVATKLYNTRPTAVNLKWAIDEMSKLIEENSNNKLLPELALAKAEEIKLQDVDVCFNIGKHGLEIIRQLATKKNNKTVNILTHCNAGWLATVDWGTATSPIYQAHQVGIDIHVWVDETRPRNQGASLTAFELNQQGVKHTLINDNTGGHLMQHGMVDLVIVGTDRTTRNGDVANKIGTYLKALAAFDNNIPFYVALPSSTLDLTNEDGVKNIPIETRDENEVKYVQGLENKEIKSVLICPETTPALNYGFDVTPARLITGLITEHGICEASETGIKRLFPDLF